VAVSPVARGATRVGVRRRFAMGEAAAKGEAGSNGVGGGDRTRMSHGKPGILVRADVIQVVSGHWTKPEMRFTLVTRCVWARYCSPHTPAPTRLFQQPHLFLETPHDSECDADAFDLLRHPASRCKRGF
jgi:hypothetical protein